MTSGDERLLTVRDVAERLSMSKRFVWTVIYDGTLPTVKLGRSVRIRESDLSKYISERVTR